MLPTARQLQKLAGETGFQVVGLEKIIRLAELLTAIGNHPELKDCLVLKGGTALNLFFGPPSSLSPVPFHCLCTNMAKLAWSGLQIQTSPGSCIRCCSRASDLRPKYSSPRLGVWSRRFSC